VDEVDDAAGVDDVEDGVVEDEGALVFGVAVILLSVGEELDLLRGMSTTSRIRQLMTTTSSDISIPFTMMRTCPLEKPSIRKVRA
jgi:hypothetical protein